MEYAAKDAKKCGSGYVCDYYSRLDEVRVEGGDAVYPHHYNRHGGGPHKFRLRGRGFLQLRPRLVLALSREKLDSPHQDCLRKHVAWIC